MNYKLDTMGSWERSKSCFLIETAQNLGMNVSGYGELAVNPNSGYTYLWLEDYSFTLYMPISCELKKSDVYVLWTNPETGEEIEESLSEFSDLDDIYNWIETLEAEEA